MHNDVKTKVVGNVMAYEENMGFKKGQHMEKNN